jgi:hypothetical protein
LNGCTHVWKLTWTATFEKQRNKFNWTVELPRRKVKCHGILASIF